MKISTSLRLSLGVILIVIVVQILLTRHFAVTNAQLIQSVVERDFDASLHISRIAIEANKLRRYEKEYFIYVGSPAKLSKYKAEWEEAYTALDGMLAQMADPRDSRWYANDRRYAQEWKASLEVYAEGFRDVVVQVESGRIDNTQSANLAIQSAKNGFRTLLVGAEHGGDEKHASATENLALIQSNNELGAMTIGTAFASSLVLAIGLLLWLPNRLRDTIEKLSAAADNMSKGKIADPIPVGSTNSEFQRLAQTLERMRISQKVLIDRMRRR